MIKALFLIAAVACGVAAPACASTVESPGRIAGELDSVKLSPSGDRIAAVVPTDQGPLLVVRAASGDKIASFPTGPTSLRRMAWAGDEHVVFEVAALLDPDEMFAQSKREYSQVFVGNLRTSKVAAAFAGKLSIAPIVAGDYGLFASKGRWGLALGGVTLSGSGEAEKDFNLKSFSVNHAWPDLYAIDLDNSRAEKISPGREVFRGWVVDGHGTPLARVQREARTGELTLVSLRSGKTLWRGPEAADTALEASGDKSGILVASVGGPLQTVDAEAPGSVKALFGAAPVRRLLRSADDRLIGAEVQAGGGAEDRFLDAAAQSAFDKAKQLAGSPEIRFVSVDAAWRRWILLAGPGDYRLVDTETGSVARYAPAP